MTYEDDENRSNIRGKPRADGGRVSAPYRVAIKPPFEGAWRGKPTVLKVPDVPRLYFAGTAARGSWTFRYVVDGRPKSVSLGTWPGMDLKTAAKRANECSSRIATGGRNGAVVPSRVTLAEAAELYRARRPSQKEIHKRIPLFLRNCGKLARRPVSEVTVQDMQQVVDQIAERSPSAASNFAVTARGVVNEARRTGLTREYMVDLRAPAIPSRRAYFDREGLSDILAVLPEMDWRFHAGTLFQLAMGCRQNEAFSLEWRDLDLPRRRWLAPATKMKNGLFHSLWLNDTALRALELARAHSGRKRGFVLSRNAAAEWTAYRPEKAKFKRLMGWPPGEKLVFHDFRRSLRALPSVQGLDSAIGDMILSHARREGKASVDASYNVRIHDEEVQAYLKAWDEVLKECQATADEIRAATGDGNGDPKV